GGEIQLTDAIQMLNEIQEVYAYDFEGERYDVGEKFGFVKTTVDMALENEEIKDELMEYLIEKIGEHAAYTFRDRIYLYKNGCEIFLIQIDINNTEIKKVMISIERVKYEKKNTYTCQ